MVQLLYSRVCHYLSKQNSLCHCPPRQSIPDKGQGCSSHLKQGSAVGNGMILEPCCHLESNQALHFQLFIVFFMKEQTLCLSLQLEGPREENRTATLWHWQMPKPLGQGGGGKTACGIRSGHQNCRGCCIFQYADERQTEERSLENILQQQRKDTLPPLPLLAQTQLLRMGLRKEICPRHISEALLHLSIFRLST